MQVNIPNFHYNMLCISAKETQKGKPNFVSHHALTKLLVEWSLRDSSPISWAQFVEFKTLQPQVNPVSQNLENEEETTRPIQNPAEKKKETSPDKSTKPNLEDDMPSSSRGKGKNKGGPNLEKEVQNPSIKVTKRKRYVLILTNPVASTLVTPRPK